MSNKLSPVIKSKPVMITTALSVGSLAYKAVDAAGNAEFLLQKLGLNEDAAKFLGSSRGIDFVVAISFIALVISLLYQVNRATLHLQGTTPGKEAPRHEPTEGLAPIGFTERPLSAPEYTYSKDWLLNIAERDRRKIDWGAIVLECKLEPDIDSESPCLRFRFTIFNGSVYPISVGKVEGFILYGTRRLQKEITLSSKLKVENLAPRYQSYAEIIQWLTDEEAAMFQNERTKQSYDTRFSFEHLRLLVSGGDDFRDVSPKPLRLTEYEGIRLNGRYG